MNNQKLTEIFNRLQKANPNPKSELQYRTPYELMVAVILSAQATDKSVNQATPALFKVANTPEKMVKLGEKKLKQSIKTIGLYNSKAKNIINASKKLIEKFDSTVPESLKELITLPGVGEKTANVILNVAFGQHTIAVDTHVFRVANRTKIATGKTPKEVSAKLKKLVPKEFTEHAHHWLILHGRYICTARKPRCSECPIHDLCEYQAKNL